MNITKRGKKKLILEDHCMVERYVNIFRSREGSQYPCNDDSGKNQIIKVV